MRNIVPANRRANVIFEDAPKPLGSVLGLKQGRAKSRRERVRDVLVLSDCMNFVRRQVRETNYVFEANHGALPSQRGRMCAPHALQA